MANSDTDSEVFFWFQNQNQSHNHKYPQSSYSAFYGSCSMSNTETNTADGEDVYEEAYKVQEISKKRKLTPIQLRLLEESFEEEKRLEPDRKLWLAKKLGVQPSQVAIWYQNRRARLKTKQLEHDCDHLKASYAKLKTDCDILFLENETLKNKVSLLKEKLKMQEKHETQSMEAEKLGQVGSSVKSENSQSNEEEERSGNQYSFPELALLGFYYDPTLTASNLRL